MINRKLLLIFLIAIIGNQFSGEILAQNARASEILEFVNQIARSLLKDCSKTIEVSYKSQELVSPDRAQSIYFEATARNLYQTNPHPGVSCPITRGETPIAKMIRIEGTRKQQSDFHSILRPRDRISQSAAVINPISWSSDSRYLLVRIDFLEGYDGYSEHLILDARNNYRLVNFQSNSLFSPCNNAQMGSEFLGFISTDIALFECRNYGEPGYVEVLNLNQRALQRVNGFGEDRRLQHYGTILSLPDIVKVQEFPAR